jgi:hypothetical protein
MLLSAVFVLVVAQPISEFPEGLMNYPVKLRPVLKGLTTTNVIVFCEVTTYGSVDTNRHFVKTHLMPLRSKTSVQSFFDGFSTVHHGIE